MVSKKRSAKAKQVAEFRASLGGPGRDDSFFGDAFFAEDDTGGYFGEGERERKGASFGGGVSFGDGGRVGDGVDDLFAREDARRAAVARQKEAALRNKACESKNRYVFRSDAEEAIRLCAEHGTTGLHAYKCDFCNGWHLTSKPERK